MPEEALTISQAFDEGLSKVAEPQGTGNGGSPDNANGSKVDKASGNQPNNDPSGAQPSKTEVKPEVKTEVKPDGQPNVKPNENKAPAIDPDSGKYNGEYSKERFDGLMSAWQKDRELSRRVPDLENKVKELETAMKNPPKTDPNPENQEDLPPELQGADPETQAGFRLMMKASKGELSKLEEKMMSKVVEYLNQPIKDETELVTKVKQEVEDLSVELGKEFADNIKDIKTYAVKHNYPLGTLRHAFTAWQKDKKIAEYESKKQDGKKTLDEIEAEKAGKGNIPTGSANRTGEIPKWDEKRDGNKDLSDIFNDVKGYL